MALMAIKTLHLNVGHKWAECVMPHMYIFLVPIASGKCKYAVDFTPTTVVYWIELDLQRFPSIYSKYYITTNKPFFPSSKGQYVAYLRTNLAETGLQIRT